MLDSQAHITESVLSDLPIRQFVFTFPFALRNRMAFDPTLCADVRRIVMRALFGFYRDRAKRKGLLPGPTGAIVATQLFATALNVNPHFHVLCFDGVFSSDDALSGDDDTPIDGFRFLGQPNMSDLIDCSRGASTVSSASSPSADSWTTTRATTTRSSQHACVSRSSTANASTAGTSIRPEPPRPRGFASRPRTRLHPPRRRRHPRLRPPPTRHARALRPASALRRMPGGARRRRARLLPTRSPLRRRHHQHRLDQGRLPRQARGPRSQPRKHLVTYHGVLAPNHASFDVPPPQRPTPRVVRQPTTTTSASTTSRPQPGGEPRMKISCSAPTASAFDDAITAGETSVYSPPSPTPTPSP